MERREAFPFAQVLSGLCSDLPPLGAMPGGLQPCLRKSQLLVHCGFHVSEKPGGRTAQRRSAEMGFRECPLQIR